MTHTLRSHRLAVLLVLSSPFTAACQPTGDATATDPSSGAADTGTSAANPTDGGGPSDGTDPADTTHADSGGSGGASLTGGGSATDLTNATGQADEGTTNSETGLTGDPGIPGLPVPLGSAGNYVILAKSAISTVPNSTIAGDLGISPAAASFITGFSLIADPTNVFSTSSQVTGKIYAADYVPPTPIELTVAITDMQLAFTAAAARPPDVVELGAGDIGGMALPAGVYRWSSNLLIPTDVTLDGSATDVWIFQVAGDLTLSNGVDVSLTGGGEPANVFWQVSGMVGIGTTAHLEGIVLSQTSIDLANDASVEGRLLAQTAVTLSGNTIVEPAQ